MSKANTLWFGAAVVAAMFVGGVVGASLLARSQPVSAAFAAASPSPSPKSNEAATHETGESAAKETAENNGTFHPAGGGPGHSNETSAHETTEPAAREASENAAATASPKATP